MHMRLSVALPIVLCLLLGPTAEAADPVELSGRVLDTEGKPAGRIRLSWAWLTQDGEWTTRTGVRADDEGKFSFETRLYSRARSLMALDASREHGAVVTLDEVATKEPLVLRLVPTTLVRGAYTCQALGIPIEKVYVSFTALPAGIAVATHRGDPAFRLRLPPGDYRVTVAGADCQRKSQRITLTKDMRIVDLGTTDLEPTIIAQHYGKAPPDWHVTDARGVNKESTLADFKGKWVLLEFWGYW